MVLAVKDGTGAAQNVSTVVNPIDSALMPAHVIADPISGQKATVSQFHNADNQALPGTAYGILTGGVAQLVNAVGGVDRQRETGVDNIPSSGIATGTQQLAAPYSTTTTQAIAANAAAQAVTLNAVSFTARGTTLTIQVGSTLLVDTGANQEAVFVTAVNTTTKAVTAIFTKAHTSGVAVTGFSFNQARDSTVSDGAPPSGMPAGAVFLFNGTLNSGAGGMEIERSAAGELDGATGAGTNIAAEYAFNSGGPMTTGTVPSGLSFDRIRTMQGKGLQATTLNGAVAAGVTTITLTAVTGLQPGMQIRLDRNTGTEEAAYVSASYVPGTLAVTLQSATLNAHATGSTAEWDIFASAGPGLAGFTPVGLTIAEEALYNPADGKYYIERSATSDAMPAANIVAESPVLWNGATFDRAKGVSGFMQVASSSGSLIDRSVVTVASASTQLMAANPNRRYLLIQNRSTTSIYLFIGTALSAPVQAAPTTATTGGSLAAATYFYVVTATNIAGETLKSNEQSITTTGTTSTNTISWGAVSGATGYKIYRGTAAGGENVFYTVGAVTTFTDTGAASTAGTPPTTNTTNAAANGAGSIELIGGEQFSMEGNAVSTDPVNYFVGSAVALTAKEM